jgi:hypothetical protein
MDLKAKSIFSVVTFSCPKSEHTLFYIDNQRKRLNSATKNTISIAIGLRLIWFNFCSVPTTGTEDMDLKAKSIFSVVTFSCPKSEHTLFYIDNQRKRLNSATKNAISIAIGLRLLWFNFCSVPITGTEDMDLKAKSIFTVVTFSCPKSDRTPI